MHFCPGIEWSFIAWHTFQRSGWVYKRERPSATMLCDVYIEAFFRYSSYYSWKGRNNLVRGGKKDAYISRNLRRISISAA